MITHVSFRPMSPAQDRIPVKGCTSALHNATTKMLPGALPSLRIEAWMHCVLAGAETQIQGDDADNTRYGSLGVTSRTRMIHHG
jgi:hypothetical protein